MKKVIFLSLIVIAFMAPGITKAQGNRTYYDAAKTKLKEVYMVQESVTMNPDDPAHSEKVIKKHGPYFYYYENGKLKIKGEYKDDEKSGTWTYYDEKGTLVKTEKYADGQLVK
jgi:antitoxin component YwqK of YwqJK toxin-antitoxin module